MERSVMGASRRALFRLAATGAGVALSTCEGQTPLKEEDRFHAGDRARIVAHAQELGREYEAKYGNCAQCTIAALQDAVEFIPKDEQVFLAGSCLHGGATASGNANCGGFTGAGTVIGHLCGRSREKFGDREATKLASRLIRDMAGRYEQAYGSVICRDVKEKASKNCPEVVARAAGWAAEVLLEQFSGG